MGAAFELLTGLIEDTTVVPPRAFSPTIVLVSDGIPTDIPGDLYRKYADGAVTSGDFLNWDPLRALLASERGSKCIRLAIGIGADTNDAMLEAFVNSDTIPVIRAQDARSIQRFFRWVTMSVSSRSVSRDPNQPVIPAFDEFDEEELAF